MSRSGQNTQDPAQLRQIPHQGDALRRSCCLGRTGNQLWRAVNQPSEGQPSGGQAHLSTTPARQAPCFRHALPLASRRITVTIPSKLHGELVERSDREGRSLSNLVAFLLETALTMPGRPLF